MLKKMFNRFFAADNTLVKESATAAEEGESLFTFFGEDGREHALYARFLPSADGMRRQGASARYLVSKCAVEAMNSDVVLMGCSRPFSPDLFVFEDERGRSVDIIKDLCM